jgi:hypothetical protein
VTVVNIQEHNIGCERFYPCRLFTIDWLKPEIVTGQYNARAGIVQKNCMDVLYYPRRWRRAI